MTWAVHLQSGISARTTMLLRQERTEGRCDELGKTWTSPVECLQREDGTEPPSSPRLSPPLLDHRALQPVGGRRRGKLPLSPS
jgi:hypothetical protein